MQLLAEALCGVIFIWWHWPSVTLIFSLSRWWSHNSIVILWTFLNLCARSVYVCVCVWEYFVLAYCIKWVHYWHYWGWIISVIACYHTGLFWSDRWGTTATSIQSSHLDLKWTFSQVLCVQFSKHFQRNNMHIKHLIRRGGNDYNKCDLMPFLCASREATYLNKLLCMPQLKQIDYFDQHICTDRPLILDFFHHSIHHSNVPLEWTKRFGELTPFIKRYNLLMWSGISPLTWSWRQRVKPLGGINYSMHPSHEASLAAIFLRRLTFSPYLLAAIFSTKCFTAPLLHYHN